MPFALLADPYAVLFSVLLFLSGAGAVLAALLRHRGHVAWPLAALFGTSAFVWLGLLGLDLTRVLTAAVTPQAINPRWILFPAAILLLATGTICLAVYGEHVAGEHAWEYRTAARLISIASSLALLGLFIQPLFA